MNENSMTMYSHSDQKSDIGWSSVGWKEMRAIGPRLGGVLEALMSKGLSLRNEHSRVLGGMSGELWIAQRRLFDLRNEEYPVGAPMGQTNVEGKDRVQVYEVVGNSTDGWSQYLSVVGNFHNPDIVKALSDLDMAPKNTYLAKKDWMKRFGINPLWISESLGLQSFLVSS